MTERKPAPKHAGVTAAAVALAIFGMMLHGLALLTASESGRPGPTYTHPAPKQYGLPPPSLGPQPSFDDGGRRFDVPQIPYTFEIPAGWVLSPHRSRDADLWPARPYGHAEITFEDTFRVRDTSAMSDSQLAVYARTAIRIWSPEQPHIAFQRTADGSRAFRFPLQKFGSNENHDNDEHYYTLIFHGASALVVSTGAGVEPTPEVIRDVQRANDAAIMSVRFR